MWVACIEHFSCNLYYIPNGQAPTPKTCRTLKAEPGRKLEAARVGPIRLRPIAAFDQPYAALLCSKRVVRFLRLGAWHVR